MSEYIYYFETEADFNQARSNNYSEPWVSYTEGKGVDYNKPYDPYLHMPFTIEALGNGNITWELGNKTVQYSKNGSSWETMNSKTTISVVEGDQVQFKGTNAAYDRNNIYSTAQFNVKGNIMSLTDDDDFETADTVNSSAFLWLFYGCGSLISASDLKLPATTLAESCYDNMFHECTSLVVAPELPATTLANSCYANMFYSCTSLTAAPKLPAITLAESCYNGMFSQCTGLTAAPELPATTLAKKCYEWMFYGCSGLTAAPELPATTLTEYCYGNMFSECTGLTAAPELSATTLAKYCCYNMFCSCSSLTAVPELHATTLVEGCYETMFRYCVNLSHIKAMFTTVPGDSYTYKWVEGVKATGTFVKNVAASWTTTGVHGVPTGWTVETATA